MHEVVRGSRVDEPAAKQALDDAATSPTAERTTRLGEHEEAVAAAEEQGNPTRPAIPEHAISDQSLTSPARHVAFRADSNNTDKTAQAPLSASRERRRSSTFFRNNSETRPEADVYFDSRAATKREWRRRATTLQDYYHDNPELLPQLPFTWHRGKKRWRLIGLIALMWIDACVVPIVLYYGLYYGGRVQNWITFAVITTIWGGPTYLEFGVRSFKLIKKERFYRPLGTNGRWCFDYLNLVSASSIFTVTALFIVGSAPHVVWLRVLCMPMPALLYCLAFFVGYPTLYHIKGWPAPFRFSSTAKGESVKPGVYYFMEDCVAVNANAGRPYREALHARYEASPRFRRMLYNQSLFWSVPAFIVAIPLTVIAVIHPVPATVAYAICKFSQLQNMSFY